MSSLISDNLFLVLLIFGGVLVSIRGHELYLKPSPRSDAQWLVNEMNMRHLTGRRQFVTGFVCYLVPVLLIYLLLAVSPELLKLSMGIAGTTNSVGALTISGSDAQTFAPMLAATAVITLFSVKPFSKLEQAIRRLSHGIAGIPHYIQDIIRQVRPMEFRSTSMDSPLPRTQLDHVKTIPGLGSDLIAIGNLHEWIFGTTGMLVWSEKADHVLQLARQRVLGDYDALKRKLSLTDPASESRVDGLPLTDDTLEEIVRQARDMRIQMTRLLALLVANQNEPLLYQSAQQSQSVPLALRALISRAQHKRASSQHMNVLAASTMMGLAISILFITLFNFSLILFHELSSNNVALNTLNNEFYISGLVAHEFYWSSFIFAAKTAWWDVFGISLIFFTGCSAALVYRTARVNNADWVWYAHDYPVFQYFIIVIIACISACLVYELYLFVSLVVLPSLYVDNAAHFASMLRDFGSDYIEFGLLAILAAPSAVIVARVSDHFGNAADSKQPGRKPWLLTIGWSVGLVSMLLYLLIRLWVGEIHELNAVLISLLVPGVTLFIMAVAYWQIGMAHFRVLPSPEGGQNALTATYSAGEVYELLQGNKVREPVA